MELENENKNRVRIPWWQRNYVVNRDLQIKFAASGAIIGLFSSVVSAGLLLWAFWAFNIWQGQRLPKPVLGVFVFILFINISGIYIAAIFATHRITGPIFNLLKQFQKVQHGDFTAKARFRENDDLHYVARRFNEMVEKLQVRNEAIFALIEKAQQALDSNDGAGAKKVLTELVETHNKVTEEESST